MRLYDLILVLRPNLTDAKRKQALEAVKALLKNIKVVKEEDLGQKVLAYAIKKEQAGTFVKLALESEIGVTKDLESKLLQNDTIIRHLLLRTK